MNRSTRRQFLKNLGLFGGSAVASHSLIPWNDVITYFSQGIISRAQADAIHTTGCYVLINLPGGPARWSFDQPIQTSPSDPMTARSYGVATHLAEGGGSLVGPAFGHHAHANGLLMPYLWSSSVASATGGQRPMAQLLQHMIAFRGYGTGQDSHPGNSARQTRPLPSLGSLGGYVADYSNSVIKALQFPVINDFSGYFSLKGRAQQIVHGVDHTNLSERAANLAARALGTFNTLEHAEARSLLALRGRHEDVVNAVHAQIDHHIQQRYPGYEELGRARNDAMQTLQKGISGLVEAWPVLLNKYLGLLTATARSRSVVGLNNLPIIVPDENVTETDWRRDESNYCMGSGSRIHPAYGWDLRELVDQVDVLRMAQFFALSEFLLTRGYTRTIETGSFGWFENLRMKIRRENGQDITPGSNPWRSFGLDLDGHSHGVVTGAFLYGTLYRTLSAGLLELTDQLKNTARQGGGNLFDDTVIQIGGEFSRTARQLEVATGAGTRIISSGADHGFDAMATSILTGRNQSGPMVIGNISVTNPYQSLWTGMWGYKAATKVHGVDRVLSPTDVVCSISEILRIPANPWINQAHPLVFLDPTTGLVRRGDVEAARIVT